MIELKKVLGFIIAMLLLTGCEKELKDNINKKDEAANNQKEYYGTQEVNFSWTYNVRDYTEVIDKAKKILKVKVIGKEDATFEYSDISNNSIGSGLPLTPIKVEVLEVLYGDTDDINIDTIYIQGGDVTIKQMKGFFTSEKIAKMGLDKISDEEAERKYISYNLTGSSSIKNDKVYIFTLGKWDSADIYFITPMEYGAFELNESTTYKLNQKETYTNAITNQSVDIDAFRK